MKKIFRLFDEKEVLFDKDDWRDLQNLDENNKNKLYYILEKFMV